MQSRTYAEPWERPEWIYSQVLDLKKAMESPVVQDLKKHGFGFYQHALSQEFSDLFQHYPKIFMRIICDRMNMPNFLMMLRQRQKIDEGQISFHEGNSEIIGASFNRLVNALPEDYREKVTKTYVDLVKEHQEDERERMEEYLRENGQLPEKGEPLPKPPTKTEKDAPRDVGVACTKEAKESAASAKEKQSEVVFSKAKFVKSDVDDACNSDEEKEREKIVVVKSDLNDDDAADCQEERGVKTKIEAEVLNEFINNAAKPVFRVQEIDFDTDDVETVAASSGPKIEEVADTYASSAYCANSIPRIEEVD